MARRWKNWLPSLSTWRSRERSGLTSLNENRHENLRKDFTIMRELNEQELDQVVGGSGGGHGWNFNHGTQATAGGGASADYGFAFSQSVTESVHSHGVSESFAANVSFAFGKNAQAYSCLLYTSPSPRD